ncbi:hypothetical protein ACHAWF_012362, partial [Thalassiosira exigua]
GRRDSSRSGGASGSGSGEHTAFARRRATVGSDLQGSYVTEGGGSRAESRASSGGMRTVGMASRGAGSRGRSGSGRGGGDSVDSGSQWSEEGLVVNIVPMVRTALGGGGGGRGGEGYHRADHGDEVENEEEGDEGELSPAPPPPRRRPAPRTRLRESHAEKYADFRTSRASAATAEAARRTSCADDDPQFWNVGARWFEEAGEFAGELAGMATRRAAADSSLGGGARGTFPRTRGVEIASAVDDYDDDDNEKDEHDRDCDDGDGGERAGFLINTYPSSGDDDDDDPDSSDYLAPFDDLSSLGDTPTGIFTADTRRQVVRGAWMLTTLFVLAYVAAGAALRSSEWYRGWTERKRAGIVGAGAPRRSRRYYQMRKWLTKGAAGGEAAAALFADEGSPQHRALVYLADGDALTLDPNDPNAYPQLAQRYALAVLYFATGGPEWKSRTYWLSGRHECRWAYVICADEDVAEYEREGWDADDDYSNLLDSELGLGEGTVVGLSLYGNGLQGTMPKEVGMLEFLHVLDLGNNNLEGTVGPEIGHLQHLRKLYLGNNMLSGGIEAIQWLSSLKRVNLDNNQLTGTIPYDTGKLKHLEDVRMGENRLNGNIPSSLLRSHSLTRLDLHENELTGELVVHEASILKYLHLYSNNLTGELLPSDFCYVSKSMVDLRLNNNSFTGKIPELNCTMEELELLSLAHNALTGHIHSTLGDQTPRLREIHLYENNLLSTIPDSIFRPENLSAVLLGNNALTGEWTCSEVTF